jgi:L-fucose mutarotase
VLKGIHPLLSPDLLHALAAMGHGDEIAIVDANFPAASLGPRLIELRGASSPDALDAVLTLFPSHARRAAVTMEVVSVPERGPRR